MLEALQQLLIEQRKAATVEACPASIDVHQQHAFVMKSGVEVLKISQSPYEEPRADQQHQRQSQLKYH